VGNILDAQDYLG